MATHKAPAAPPDVLVDAALEADHEDPEHGRYSFRVEDGIHNLVFTVADRLWQRWSCSDDDCPGRPAWDRELSEAASDVGSQLAADVAALARERIIGLVETFQTAHPDAVLAQPAEVAAA